VSVGKIIRNVVGAVVLAGVLVVAATAVRVWQVARQDNRPHSDAIVVLGASQYNGTPSEVFMFRLQHALDLYKAGVAPRVVTVGGNRKGDLYTEAGSGAKWLQERGVPASALFPVQKGSDTLQSMKAASVVFRQHGWHSAVLVTDPWHELRSQKMAEDQGIKAATSPTHSGPAVRTRSTEVRYIARETAGYLYYRLFHASSESGPSAV
jgi:vancomycin permeability regulator SanA